MSAALHANDPRYFELWLAKNLKKNQELGASDDNILRGKEPPSAESIPSKIRNILNQISDEEIGPMEVARQSMPASIGEKRGSLVFTSGDTFGGSDFLNQLKQLKQSSTQVSKRCSQAIQQSFKQTAGKKRDCLPLAGPKKRFNSRSRASKVGSGKHILGPEKYFPKKGGPEVKSHPVSHSNKESKSVRFTSQKSDKYQETTDGGNVFSFIETEKYVQTREASKEGQSIKSRGGRSSVDESIYVNTEKMRNFLGSTSKHSMKYVESQIDDEEDEATGSEDQLDTVIEEQNVEGNEGGRSAAREGLDLKSSGLVEMQPKDDKTNHKKEASGVYAHMGDCGKVTFGGGLNNGERFTSIGSMTSTNSRQSVERMSKLRNIKSQINTLMDEFGKKHTKLLPEAVVNEATNPQQSRTQHQASQTTAPGTISANETQGALSKARGSSTNPYDPTSVNQGSNPHPYKATDRSNETSSHTGRSYTADPPQPTHPDGRILSEPTLLSNLQSLGTSRSGIIKQDLSHISGNQPYQGGFIQAPTDYSHEGLNLNDISSTNHGTLLPPELHSQMEPEQNQAQRLGQPQLKEQEQQEPLKLSQMPPVAQVIQRGFPQPEGQAASEAKVPLAMFRQLQEVAIGLSVQNQNLQKIAIDQNAQLQQKSKQIDEMDKFILNLKAKYEERIQALTFEHSNEVTLLTDRLLLFENNSEFEDILTLYNEQMIAVDKQNELLLNELKKLTSTLAVQQHQLPQNQGTSSAAVSKCDLQAEPTFASNNSALLGGGGTWIGETSTIDARVNRSRSGERPGILKKDRSISNSRRNSSHPRTKACGCVPPSTKTVTDQTLKRTAQTLKKLSNELGDAQKELSEFRKKERIYQLYRRCMGKFLGWKDL